MGAALALAAAIALIAFVGGYLAGYRHTEQQLRVRPDGRAHQQQGAGGRPFRPRDANGNTPMQRQVEGLKSFRGRLLLLYMTKDGKPVVVCGSFNVGGPRVDDASFPVLYDPANFDGLELARWVHGDHKTVPVVSAQIS